MASLDQDVTEAAVRTWCGDYLAKALRIRRDRIDDDANFASFGLDSAESVFMVTALEDWLGLELDSETAIEHPTVTELARFIMTRLADRRSAPPTKKR
jgi:acyl carrier protein